MLELLRFFWNSTRALALLRGAALTCAGAWETYSGLKMDKIGFVEFSPNKAAASRVAVADKGSTVVVTIAG